MGESSKSANYPIHYISLELSLSTGGQLPADRLTYSEKLMVMKKLEEKGVFLFKGAIPEVARQLAISEATAYRYLSKIERGSVNGQD